MNGNRSQERRRAGRLDQRDFEAIVRRTKTETKKELKAEIYAEIGEGFIKRFFIIFCAICIAIFGLLVRWGKITL